MPATKACVDCKQEFPLNERGLLVVPLFDFRSTICERCDTALVITYEEDGQVAYHCPNRHIRGHGAQYYGRSSTRCPHCNEARRKKNHQAYPHCPMCNTPTRVHRFLRTYQGFSLDLIKICCTDCIPRFEALPEAEQVERLCQAIVAAYGEKAYIYAIQYDDSGQVHHIGRTKHLLRRMAEYRRDWYCEVKTYQVLEELSFGGLSMERESRWMMHGLKHGWPIDNFDMFTVDRHLDAYDAEVRENEQQRKTLLQAAIADIEPLTTPFEVIEPLLRKFSNTGDARIVHWFVVRMGIGS